MGDGPVRELPVPPAELRRLVGPTDLEPFDNATGALVFPGVPEHAYAVVFDFGCGCGRLARQLMQQRLRPGRYLGVDPHKGMVEWCRTHLTPHAPEFQFRHHDVFHEFVNPDGKLDLLALPAADREVTLFVAWSVFTHLLERDADFYLGELARVLSPSGVAITTWFLFDKRNFPMMQAFQNALFISDFDPTNAVLFDRGWLCERAARAGLVMTRVAPPAIRGFQWTIELQQAGDGRTWAAFPEDLAPHGLARPPAG
jgi:SAM-dependent methyltransferase